MTGNTGSTWFCKTTGHQKAVQKAGCRTLIETLGSPLSRSACWCLQAENLPGWGPTTHPGWTLAHNVLRTPWQGGSFCPGEGRGDFCPPPSRASWENHLAEQRALLIEPSRAFQLPCRRQKPHSQARGGLVTGHKVRKDNTWAQQGHPDPRDRSGDGSPVETPLLTVSVNPLFPPATAR